MKNILTLIIFAALLSVHSSIFSQTVGIGTTTPDPSAVLELSSTNKGFLPPRVQLTATNISSPVNSPAVGLLVYNTSTAGVAPYNVVPGYYYWNGSAWYAISNKAVHPGDMQYWNGTEWVIIPIGTNEQTLTICQGVPKWGPCNTTLVINPVNNPNVGQLTSNAPNGNGIGSSQITMAAWTSGGPLNIRSILKFDYTGIPTGIVVDSAKLFLFATPNPQGGNGVDAHVGAGNACYVRRITTPWSAPSPFTWNNPPAFSTSNEAIIPQSSGSFDDNVINVTGMVNDMLQDGNHGFYIRLVNESPYNTRQYVSSYSSLVALHPKLIVYYH